jgi:hypothetical protein
VWALLALGCVGGPTDRARYATLIADDAVPIQDGLRACDALGDVGLRGDCRLAMLAKADAAGATNLERWCPDFEPGVFRGECWFVVAENRSRRGRTQSAVTACLSAAPFVDDCAQHLWQRDLHELIHGRGPGAFLEVLPQARALHDRWAPLLAQKTDFEGRFWSRYYQNGFEGVGLRLDLAACDRLHAQDAMLCVSAARSLLARELGPQLDRRGADPCAWTDRSSSAVSAVWEMVPDPRLDDVVASQVAVLCPE